MLTPLELSTMKEACQKSLKFLCTRVLWANQMLKDWAEPLHDDLAAFLNNRREEWHSMKKLILLPRNHLKSAIVTQAWSIQQVLINPNLRVLISCNTWENARKFLGAIQRSLVLSSLPAFFGNFTSTHWNQDECTVTQRTQNLVAPTWATTGTEKQQTSQHYDLIIHDDLVDEENSRTKELRDKVKQVYRNSWDLLEPGGRIVVIGTRKHQDDLYAELLEQEGWDVLIREAYRDDERKSVWFPQKFTLEKLADLRAIKGAYHFASEYLNNPIDEEAADFKASWIKTYDPTNPPPGSLYLTVDPAISLGADADYSAMVVAGQYADRRIRVVDGVRRRLVPSDLVETIFALVKKWRLHRVGIETFAFQKTLKYDIQRQQRERGIFFSIDELGKRHSGRGEQVLSKEARIRRLQPYFEQGLVEIRNDMSELRDELMAFPRGKHDDLIDALAYQLDYLVPSQNRITPKEPEQVLLEGGRLAQNMTWWLRQMPEKQGSMYDRFMKAGMG